MGELEKLAAALRQAKKDLDVASGRLVKAGEEYEAARQAMATVKGHVASLQQAVILQAEQGTDE